MLKYWLIIFSEQGLDSQAKRLLRKKQCVCCNMYLQLKSNAERPRENLILQFYHLHQVWANDRTTQHEKQWLYEYKIPLPVW